MRELPYTRKCKQSTLIIALKPLAIDSFCKWHCSQNSWSVHKP